MYRLPEWNKESLRTISVLVWVLVQVEEQASEREQVSATGPEKELVLVAARAEAVVSDSALEQAAQLVLVC